MERDENQLKRITFKQIVSSIIATSILVLSFPAEAREQQSATANTTVQYSSSDVTSSSGFTYENKNETMSIDENTTAVSIKLKASGKVWSTNPPPEEMVKVANDGIREELSSQINISYTDAQGKNATISNFAECIAKKQYTVKKIDNGFRVDYVIGNPDGRSLVPEVMGKKKFEAYLAKMSADDKKTVSDYYNFYEYDKIGSESAKKELLAKIPKLRTTSVYVSRSLAPKVEKRLADIFTKSGLTTSDLISAYKEVEFVSVGKDSARFLISIEYRLDNESFTVTVPKDSLEYDRAQFFINSVSLLKYFGAQSKGHKGYILVPDGSGAIINLDSNKALSYSKSVYGNDNTYADTKFTGYTENTALPIYGIKSDEEAFFAIIEKNAASANISAGSSATNNGYNFVNGDFKITPSEFYRMSTKSRSGLSIYSERKLSDDITTRYFFLSGEKANYSSMAEKYRNYLFNDRKKIDSNSKSPLFLESYGSIQITSYDWGFPIKLNKELTTYLQAKKILSELNANGIEDINYKYVGWANGGMESKAPVKVDLLHNLGEKSDFQALLDFFKNSKNHFFPDIDLEYVKADTWFDGFTPKVDAARNLDNTVARKFDYNVATLTPNVNTYKYLISSDKYLPFSKQFLNAFKKYNQTNISLGTLGKDLNSNFYVKQNEITRDESSKNIMNTLKYYADNKYDIMTTYGNSYSLPYVSDIIDTPVDGSNYDIETATIPFMQMVFHGYIDYAGSAINLAGDYEDLLLKSIESGANLHFFVNYATTEKIRDTDYTYMFSAQYASLKPTIISDYQKAAKLLDIVRGSVIVSHKIIQDGLRVTEYDNGVQAVVNYTENDITYNNTIVPARDFVVIHSLG
jgi:hypothetical protein